MFYTHLEDYIHDLFLSIGIKTPADLNMNQVAKKLGIEIVYKNHPFRLDNEIILNKTTKQQEWIDFGHEACHYLRHVGNQLGMHKLYRDLQEYQSNYFAYHFCVPTFMLAELITPTYKDIMNFFNVDFEFAIKRLEMYQNKMLYQNYGYYLVTS